MGFPLINAGLSIVVMSLLRPDIPIAKVLIKPESMLLEKLSLQVESIHLENVYSDISLLRS